MLELPSESSFLVFVHCPCKDATVPGVWPDWIRGRVVEETSTGLGTSTVKINLPVLTEEQRNDFQTFEVEWRRLGESSWEKTTTSTTSSSVNLPGELTDGSYEVRVRATGTGGTTLYTMPLRFPLRGLGERILCFLPCNSQKKVKVHCSWVDSKDTNIFFCV